MRISGSNGSLYQLQTSLKETIDGMTDEQAGHVRSKVLHGRGQALKYLIYQMQVEDSLTAVDSEKFDTAILRFVKAHLMDTMADYISKKDLSMWAESVQAERLHSIGCNWVTYKESQGQGSAVEGLRRILRPNFTNESQADNVEVHKGRGRRLLSNLSSAADIASLHVSDRLDLVVASLQQVAQCTGAITDPPPTPESLAFSSLKRRRPNEPVTDKIPSKRKAIMTDVEDSESDADDRTGREPSQTRGKDTDATYMRAGLISTNRILDVLRDID